MGRAPCCDKANVKKGPWSPEEDAKLKAYIEQNGTGSNWIALPQKIGLKRCGKSCRLRWLNYLRPNIKHGGFSEEEDTIICSLYISIGSRWSIIAAQLPGRTDNDIKNYWNTRLKKRLLGKQRKEHQILQASLRQEIKKENQNFMAPVDVINHQQTHHYWPELPSSSSSSLVMPVINNPISLIQDSHFLDQESLRNLLIKLGGRLSDDDNNNNNSNQDSTNISNYPIDGSCITQDQPYSNMVSSSTAAIVNGAGPSLFQGLDGFPVEFDELIYSNNQQQLQGLESFYGSMEMGNGGSGISNGAISSGESCSWGNVSSMAYPQLVSEFETCLQSFTQDHSSFEVSSYFGPQ